jgi:hypothetical protein
MPDEAAQNLAQARIHVRTHVIHEDIGDIVFCDVAHEIIP